MRGCCWLTALAYAMDQIANAIAKCLGAPGREPDDAKEKSVSMRVAAIEHGPGSHLRSSSGAPTPPKPKPAASSNASILAPLAFILLYFAVCIGAITLGSLQPLPSTADEALRFLPASLGLMDTADGSSALKR